MSLPFAAAQDVKHAFEILSAKPRKTMKNHMAEEPEGESYDQSAVQFNAVQ